MKFNAKKVINSTCYDGELLRWKRSTVKKYNDIGGLRLFSFGDYMIEHREMIQSILNDAAEIGLKIKVITKVTDFVEHFHDHPAVNVINLSVDTDGSGIPIENALYYRKYYHKVRVRCVVLKDSDIDYFIGQGVDVFTFNHANNTARYGFKKYSAADRDRYAAAGIPVCCTGKTCFECPLKCAE